MGTKDKAGKEPRKPKKKKVITPAARPTTVETIKKG
jgi:hypothetical protein